MTALLVFAPLIILLGTAAGWDLATYTIPNLISILIVAGFALFAISTGLTAAVLVSHVFAALIALVIGFALFAFGYIGGADAKMFAAIAAWLGLHDLLEYALVASLCGGAMTLGLLAMRQYPLPAGLAARGWISRLHSPEAGVPYGVALAAGALIILPYTDVFHRVVG